MAEIKEKSGGGNLVAYIQVKKGGASYTLNEKK